MQNSPSPSGTIEQQQQALSSQQALGWQQYPASAGPSDAPCDTNDEGGFNGYAGNSYRQQQQQGQQRSRGTGAAGSAGGGAGDPDGGYSSSSDESGSDGNDDDDDSDDGDWTPPDDDEEEEGKEEEEEEDEEEQQQHKMETGNMPMRGHPNRSAAMVKVASDTMAGMRIGGRQVGVCKGAFAQLTLYKMAGSKAPSLEGVECSNLQ